MTRYNRDPAGICRNCGEPIKDGQSPTGFVHMASGRTRCDGRSLSGVSTETIRAATFPMAVLA